MIERALLTAGIVIVIIGALSALGEQAEKLSATLSCKMQGQAVCAASSNDETDNGNDETPSSGSKARNKDRKRRP